jgi:hypothetical protein
MAFRKTKSFGPRISLTERQREKLQNRLNAAGLTCFIEQCVTGSVYVSIDLPEWSQNIRGEWFNDLDSGCGRGIAKIRLSGHEEGIAKDSSHNCIGSKAECLAALKRWIAEIIVAHSEAGKAALAAVPEGTLAEV